MTTKKPKGYILYSADSPQDVSLEHFSFKIGNSVSFEECQGFPIGVDMFTRLPGDRTVKTLRMPDQDEALVFRLWMDKYSFLPMHQHPDADKIFVVLSGSCFDSHNEIYIYANRTGPSGANSIANIPAGTMHMLQCERKAVVDVYIKKAQTETKHEYPAA